MKYRFLFYAFIIAVIILSNGCKIEQEIKGIYYDPPGSTITTDKEIFLQHKRTIFFSSSGVYASNEFEGARLNDFYRSNDSTYIAVFEPENEPINNSAWYSFKLWSDNEQQIYLNLHYKNGCHRYVPKLSYDGRNWEVYDSTTIVLDSLRENALLKLTLLKDTLWFSAQELITSSFYEDWEDGLAQLPFVTKSSIGKSSEGKSINKLMISESNPGRNYIVITGRQHPPEVTGFFALRKFVETLTGETEISTEFRKEYNVIVIPLVNPDGVDNGHWRHNLHGVDLNRDWVNFNQPEPQAVRNEIQRITGSGGKLKFFIDFHSTQADVFYTLSLESTISENYNDAVSEKAKENNLLVNQWLKNLQSTLPDYFVNVIDTLSDAASPTSDRWIQRSFNIPAMTYEVGDETNRELIDKIAETAAIEFMKLMIQITGKKQELVATIR